MRGCRNKRKLVCRGVYTAASGTGSDVDPEEEEDGSALRNGISADRAPTDIWVRTLTLGFCEVFCCVVQLKATQLVSTRTSSR